MMLRSTRNRPSPCLFAVVRAAVHTVFVRDMDLTQHDHMDGRWLEVVADGLPLHGGAQDTAMVSPLHRDGSARQGAVAHDGAALRQAHTRKVRTCPEVAGEGGKARLVVLAAEVGGRWLEETEEFLSSLTWAKVAEDLQRDGRRSWLRRRKELLGCTAAKAFAMSLHDLAPSGSDGAIPSVHEVICEAPHS